MIIDDEPLLTAAEANDNEELMLSADAAVRIAGDVIERELVADLERWAHSRGIEGPQVKRVVNLFALWLTEIRSQRLQTAKQVLQAVRSSATSVQ